MYILHGLVSIVLEFKACTSLKTLRMIRCDVDVWIVGKNQLSEHGRALQQMVLQPFSI